MQVHTVFAEHPAEPGTAVEAHVDLPGLLEHHFPAPGFELLLHPGLGLGEGGGADDAAADAVREEVGMLHGLVVGGARLDDLADNLVLGGCADGQDDRKGE